MHASLSTWTMTEAHATRGTFARLRGALIALVAGVALAGCGAGGVETRENPVTTPPEAAGYTGPAPASADVQAFRINLWDNIKGQNRCGACHVPGNQSPMFARGDDVNLAYQAATPIVDLAQPSNSLIVTKVGAGHHCWLANNSACADALTAWIRNWAGTALGAGGQQVVLQPPPIIEPGASRSFPASPSDFATTVHPLLTQYCARCHAPTAASPVGPYFAQTNAAAAYEAAKAKINLDTPALSRFVVRLRDEFHNCWNNDCAGSANQMQAAIEAFRGRVPLTEIDPSYVLSKALTLYDGTVASGGNRVESNLIAKFEFKTGTGTVAYDTSGVEPAVNLNFSGDVQWVGGWGVRVANRGKLQGTTAGSKKLADRIKATGEYTVEAWIAPANVTQEMAHVVSYSGGATTRNFTLAQHLYDYDFYNRSTRTNANGMPELSTPAAQQIAQATLQHVVLTYDPVNGRRIFVNGRRIAVNDAQAGGSIAEWDDTFALVLGNEVSSNRPWTGVIRMVALYNRAYSLEQIQTNYEAGVGERYYLLFSVAHLVNVPQSYVLFEVSQLDSYGYQFSEPTFISLDAAARPDGIRLKGMRVGVNGTEPKAGQAWVPLDTTLTAAGYDPVQGFRLSPIGTVVPLEKGPASDQFFLTFEQLGSRTNVRVEAPLVVPQPVDQPRPADIGVRSFERVNAALSTLTSVPITETNVAGAFQRLQQQLPTTTQFQGFVASHQTGVAQLAIQYCDSLVNDATLRGAYFPGFNIGSPLTGANRDAVVNALVTRMVNYGTTQLATQPDAAAVSTEVNALIGRLQATGASTPTIVKAACASVAGSAAMLVQ